MNGKEQFYDQFDNKELKSLVTKLLNQNANGMLVVNEKLEVIYMNEVIGEFFDYDLNLGKKYFGNIVNCGYIDNNNEFCGTKRRCKNCKFRNAVKSALMYNIEFNNLQFSLTFNLKNEKVSKWFDLSVMPIDIKEKRYLIITLYDLTKLIQYKIEIEMKNFLVEDELIEEKNKFHEKVINFIESKSFINNEIYMHYIALNDLEKIQNYFGYLWKNDYLKSFYETLQSFLEIYDVVCRYCDNAFIVFTPFSNHNELEKLIKSIKDFKHPMFKDESKVDVVSARIQLSDARIDELIRLGTLDVEYFKVFSNIEDNLNQEWIEIVF